MKQKTEIQWLNGWWGVALGVFIMAVSLPSTHAQNKSGAAQLGKASKKTTLAEANGGKAVVNNSGKEVVRVAEPPNDLPQETEMDLPGSFHKYYGQNVNQYRDTERKIAKLDIDGDLNYDGTIDNFDPADNGAFEQTPPGLVLGVGEMTRIIVRLNPYRVDFNGEAVVTAEVVGINRAAKSGLFDSFEQESASVGHIRVWESAAKEVLLLDSRNPEKRFHEWVVDDRKFPANLPDAVPRTIYVEGVSPSGRYIGDLRLLFTVSHRAEGGNRESYADYRKKLVKTFRTTFDHILFTVKSQPQEKRFINNNVEGVWIGAGNPSVGDTGSK